MYTRGLLFSSGLALLIGLTGPALAVESSSTSAASQSMDARADDFEFDLEARQATYTGNVVFSQGAIKLNADKVQAYLNEANQLIKLEAFGNPARLKDGQTADVVELEGRTLIYEPPAARVTATGNPRLNRNRDHLQAFQIQYNTQTQKALAVGSASHQVQIQLMPATSAASSPPDL